MSFFDDIAFEAGAVARSLFDYVKGGSLRLGVTGLSRAGKTVFVTALIENLIAGTRMPVFAASAEGRISRARLEPQPDDAVPRFPYEGHLAALSGPNREWPRSTQRISQLRLRIEFERAKGWGAGPAALNLDIVDYPGEWLLDLPLLDKTYAQWSREAMAASREPARAALAGAFLGCVGGLDTQAPADEDAARLCAATFTAYLRAARADVYALSTLPPGRFLMPGDLEGSPALTFAPLPLDDTVAIASGSLAAMMERRYEAYKTHVVRPFFRDHFSRLDRQIVLVDALSALNSGPAALRDLENALTETLAAFRAGRASTLSQIFRPRVDRILFAATKADHLHQDSHDRLEAILREITAKAIARAEGVGARIDVIAMAAIRATREARITQGGASLDAIIGVPEAGEKLDGQVFDGAAEVAVFPGELPADPRMAFEGHALALPESDSDWRFVKFRPPIAARGAPPPHIRLDRALQFLIGDRLA
jgi:predicted YcjX-like family ATPase